MLRQILYESGQDPPVEDRGKNIGRQPDLVKAVRLLDAMITTPTTTTKKPVSKTTTTKATEATKKIKDEESGMPIIIGSTFGAVALLAGGGLALYKYGDKRVESIEGQFEGEEESMLVE